MMLNRERVRASQRHSKPLRQAKPPQGLGPGGCPSARRVGGTPDVRWPRSPAFAGGHQQRGRGRRFLAHWAVPCRQAFVGLIEVQGDLGCGCWGKQPGTDSHRSPQAGPGAATLTARRRACRRTAPSIEASSAAMVVVHRPGKKNGDRRLLGGLSCWQPGDDLYTDWRRLTTRGIAQGGLVVPLKWLGNSRLSSPWWPR